MVEEEDNEGSQNGRNDEDGREEQNNKDNVGHMGPHALVDKGKGRQVSSEGQSIKCSSGRTGMRVVGAYQT